MKSLKITENKFQSLKYTSNILMFFPLNNDKMVIFQTHVLYQKKILLYLFSEFLHLKAGLNSYTITLTLL